MSVPAPHFFTDQGIFTIEEANFQHDLTKIVVMINFAYKKVQYLKEERISLVELHDLIGNEKKKLYLCLSPTREICGTLLVDYFEGQQAEIDLFAIHPQYQRSQIGLKFMTLVENETFKKVSTIVLKVIPLFQERLLRFYESLGYKKTEKTLELPEPDKERYIRPECRHDIYFSILQKTRRSAL